MSDKAETQSYYPKFEEFIDFICQKHFNCNLKDLDKERLTKMLIQCFKDHRDDGTIIDRQQKDINHYIAIIDKMNERFSN